MSSNKYKSMNSKRVNEVCELLVKNPQVIGFVKLVSPLDLVKSISNNFELAAQDALIAALGLVKQTDIQQETFLKELSIELNSGYPIAMSKRDLSPVNKPENFLSPEEAEEKIPNQREKLKEDMPYGSTSGFVGPRGSSNEFPPDGYKRPQAKKWPYDDFTVAGMGKTGKGVFRGNKRGYGGASDQ